MTATALRGAADVARRTPGDLAHHPAVVAAVAVLVANDHWAKARFHNTVTGKLSDAAGLVFFPLLLVAVWEVLGRAQVRPGPARTVVALVGVVFAATKVGGPATWFDEWAVGALRWPFRAAAALRTGADVPSVVPLHVTRDLTDLACLVALVVPWWMVGHRVPGQAGRER